MTKGSAEYVRGSAEYVRGREAGYRVARKTIEAHGRERVEEESRALRTDARKPGSDEFDRGYALGYMDALRGDPVPAASESDEVPRGE